MGLLKTKEEWRGQGCAKACINNLSLEMRSHGIIPFVYIEDDNEASKKLFETLGFEKTHTASWICYLPPENKENECREPESNTKCYS